MKIYFITHCDWALCEISEHSVIIERHTKETTHEGCTVTVLYTLLGLWPPWLRLTFWKSAGSNVRGFIVQLPIVYVESFHIEAWLKF